MNLRLFLRLGRVSNLPTVWSNVVAGAVLSGVEPPIAVLGLLVVAMSSVYVAGMFLNDAFDREIDAKERPERPIPSGLISARTVFVWGFGLLVFGVGLVAVQALGLVAVQALGFSGQPRPWAVLGSCALGGLVVAYDAHHKKNPWSPLLMAMCRVLVYCVAGYSLTNTPSSMLWAGMCALGGYLAFVTFAAKREKQHHIPIGALIAGISLVDAVWIAAMGEGRLALVAVVAFCLTLVGQRWIVGT